ncbi:unnamed protein product [Mucor hiemalis]
MRTKAIKSLPKDIFSSIDNQQPPTSTRTFKFIQSDNKNIPIAVVNNKENRNSHAFITSSYDCNHIPLKHHQPRPFYKHIAHTFITNENHDRVLPTIQRPTMGGKTISSIHNTTPSTVVTTRMSSEELKLLSRRIDPHEPLSSPHASPTKPPLPVLTKKRRRSMIATPTTTTTTTTTTTITTPTTPTTTTITPTNNNNNSPPAKIQKTTNNDQFVCEPCNKKYKTRNGYQYHAERCKYLLFESTIANTVIQCICDEPAASDQHNMTLIECTQCNTWLHLKCVGSPVVDESRFCCPRCLDVTEDDAMEGEHLLQNGTTIKLSELCQAKERGKNLLQSFIDTTQEEPFKSKPIRNEFNFISLFSDDTLTSYSPVLQSSWEQQEQTQEEEEEEEEDIPSLLFSDNMDELPSSDLSLPQSDWFHFANFEDDYLVEQEQQDFLSL